MIIKNMTLFSRHETLLSRLPDEPYSTKLRLRLAQSYARLGYPDLAAGEAYIALLLSDEILDTGGEYHDEVFTAAVADMRATGKEWVDELGEEALGSWAKEHVERVT